MDRGLARPFAARQFGHKAAFASFHLTERCGNRGIEAWASTVARWKTSGAAVAEKEAAARRATDAQVLEDAEQLIVAWNERQAKRMPMIFSPTIGAAIAARYWYLWVCCPAYRTINAIDLRTLDRHRDASVTTSFPHCPVVRAGRMRHSQSWCDFQD